MDERNEADVIRDNAFDQIDNIAAIRGEQYAKAVMFSTKLHSMVTMMVGHMIPPQEDQAEIKNTLSLASTDFISMYFVELGISDEEGSEALGDGIRIAESANRHFDLIESNWRDDS